jgi:uncharacterized protein YneF (UPF0154 family)
MAFTKRIGLIARRIRGCWVLRRYLSERMNENPDNR